MEIDDPWASDWDVRAFWQQNAPPSMPCSPPELQRATLRRAWHRGRHSPKTQRRAARRARRPLAEDAETGAQGRFFQQNDASVRVQRAYQLLRPATPAARGAASRYLASIRFRSCGTGLRGFTNSGIGRASVTKQVWSVSENEVRAMRSLPL